MTTTIQNPITDERRIDLLVSALEGGSNYWYWLRGRAMNIVGFIAPADKSTPTVDRIWKALKLGLALPVHDIETKELLGSLSLESILEGEKIMVEKYPSHFADIINENDDASTADVWLQLAVMKEIVYG